MKSQMKKPFSLDGNLAMSLNIHFTVLMFITQYPSIITKRLDRTSIVLIKLRSKQKQNKKLKKFFGNKTLIETSQAQIIKSQKKCISYSILSGKTGSSTSSGSSTGTYLMEKKIYKYT